MQSCDLGQRSCNQLPAHKPCPPAPLQSRDLDQHELALKARAADMAAAQLLQELEQENAKKAKKKEKKKKKDSSSSSGGGSKAKGGSDQGQQQEQQEEGSSAGEPEQSGKAVQHTEPGLHDRSNGQQHQQQAGSTTQAAAAMAAPAPAPSTPPPTAQAPAGVPPVEYQGMGHLQQVMSDLSKAQRPPAAPLQLPPHLQQRLPPHLQHILQRPPSPLQQEQQAAAASPSPSPQQQQQQQQPDPEPEPEAVDVDSLRRDWEALLEEAARCLDPQQQPVLQARVEALLPRCQDAGISVKYGRKVLQRLQAAAPSRVALLEAVNAPQPSRCAAAAGAAAVSCSLPGSGHCRACMPRCLLSGVSGDEEAPSLVGQDASCCPACMMPSTCQLRHSLRTTLLDQPYMQACHQTLTCSGHTCCPLQHPAGRRPSKQQGSALTAGP